MRVTTHKLCAGQPRNRGSILGRGKGVLISIASIPAGAYPASYAIGTEGSSPRNEATGANSMESSLFSYTNSRSATQIPEDSQPRQQGSATGLQSTPSLPTLILSPHLHPNCKVLRNSGIRLPHYIHDVTTWKAAVFTLAAPNLMHNSLILLFTLVSGSVSKFCDHRVWVRAG
jgi:hypothetical protein